MWFVDPVSGLADLAEGACEVAPQVIGVLEPDAESDQCWGRADLAFGRVELAIGFSVGLLRVSILLAAIIIGAQAFVAAQIGVRLGARLGEELRERAEQLAGVVLATLGVVFLAGRVL
jgi:hypothetical protein